MTELRDLLKEACEKNASDIHITVGSRPLFRIKGILETSLFPVMKAGDTLEILLSLMNAEQRDIFERESCIDLSMSREGMGRFRVNAYRQRGFITITMRLVDENIPDAASLGLPDEVLELCSENRGLILITGPAGAGKSTVMASLIDRINDTRACNIITIEDPIEYIHKNKRSVINQREVGVDSKDCISAISAALRQDPDVIVAGEIRNEEEAAMLLTAAETGRLVFSEFYTMTAEDSIEAFLNMFPEQRRAQTEYRLGNVLRAIISRQLILSGEGEMKPVYEILMVDNVLKEMIRENRIRNIREYIENNPDKGMKTMDNSIYELFKNGFISRREAVKVSVDQEAMRELTESSES